MNKDQKWLKTCIQNAETFRTCARAAYYAVIVDRSGRVVGTGYNGVPSGMTHCLDGGCPRASSDCPSRSEYGNCLAVHAEANALLYSDYTARQGGTLYVNGVPCWDCAKLIVASRIGRVVWSDDGKCDLDHYLKIREFFDDAEVRFEGHVQEDLQAED